MSKGYLLGVDGGVASQWYEHADGTATLRHVEDAEPVMEYAKMARAQGAGQGNAHGKYVASVPATMAFKWRKDWETRYRDKWEWKTFVAMKLNSRELRDFRIWEGRV